MKRDFLFLGVCTFLTAASSHVIRSPARSQESSTCRTHYGFGNAAPSPLPTIHNSPEVSTVTVTNEKATTSTKSHGAPTVATTTVLTTEILTSHHTTNVNVVTKTSFTRITTTEKDSSTSTYLARATTVHFTTTVGATTEPAPSGFVPVEDSLAGSDVQRRAAGKHKPDLTTVAAGSHPNGVPRSVVCDTVVQSTITVTSTPTAVVHQLAAGEKTVTVTRTVTQTKHSFPNNPPRTITRTSTVTITSHTTDVRTITSTPTVTKTSSIPVSTLYAACEVNNLVNQVNDYPIDGYGLAVASFDEQSDSIVSYSYQSADTAYDCCVLAQQTNNSIVFFYTGWDFGPGQDQCLIFVSDSSCPVPSNQYALFAAVYNGTASQHGASYANYLGNSHCGGGGSVFGSAVNYTITAETGSEVTEGGGVNYSLGTESTVSGR